MKKIEKKLTLHKVTVQTLTLMQLGAAAGGVIASGNCRSQPPEWC